MHVLTFRRVAAGLALIVSFAGARAGGAIDVLTYHYDEARTGWNPHETALTVASVGSSRFGLLKTLAVDGDVLAQPLLVAGLRLPDASVHDVLLVVTELNSVYAFDAADWSTLWHVNLGTPQNASDVSCGHVHPYYGISATPVIVRKDAGHATVYLVSATEPSQGVFHTRLHALDLADGSAVHKAVEIAASATMKDGSTIAFSPAWQWIRSGLAYHDGAIYLAASSHCDGFADRIGGWLMRYDEQLSQTGAFTTILTPASYQLAAIWAAGFAPAIDHDGTVFAVTGNGNFSKGGRDWGETVLRLAPGLGAVDDFFTPASYQSLNAGDTDFGSGGVMLLPVHKGQKAPPMAVAMGKDHTLYLLDRSHLGHEHTGDTGALQAQRLSGSGVWGGPCYWRGAGGGLVYYQASGDVMRAYALDEGATPSLTQVATGTTNSSAGGSLPVVSSSESKAGTGVLWTINRASPPALEAYDAQKLGTPVFRASLPPWTAGSAFLTPMVANGRVYVGTSKAVSVFGMTD